MFRWMVDGRGQANYYLELFREFLALYSFPTTLNVKNFCFGLSCLLLNFPLNFFYLTVDQASCFLTASDSVRIIEKKKLG